jgi:preprotein translocase subunit SecG
MITLVLVIHLMICIAMVAIILLQRSEGGALGIGGGGGFMSGRGSGNVLTRTTAYLAAAFFVTSIALTVLADLRTTGPSLGDTPGTTRQGPSRSLPDLQPIIPPSTPQPEVPRPE